MKVYLAGPITGCTYEGCTDWREYARDELYKDGIIGVSPMRAKEYLSSENVIKHFYETPLSCARGIITRDRWDTTRCDIVLANFLGADKVSIGTVMELAWADSVRTPVIVVMEKEGNPHDHPMINEVTGFRVETLEEGLEIAKAILLEIPIKWTNVSIRPNEERLVPHTLHGRHVYSQEEMRTMECPLPPEPEE